jgi:hypothetical protein
VVTCSGAAHGVGACLGYFGFDKSRGEFVANMANSL